MSWRVPQPPLAFGAITVTIAPATSIDVAVAAMLKMAKTSRCRVSADFNGTRVVVTPTSKMNAVINEYWKARRD